MVDRTSFDRMTRIVAGDDGTTYDGVAITMHWVTALLVVTLFALAETWDWFSKPTQETMQSLHVSLGTLLAAVIIARLVWRWIPDHQVAPLDAGWLKIASKAGHYLLYVLLVAQAALGFAFRWAQGHPVGFFGVFGIPSPFGAFTRQERHLIHDLHEKIGWAIIILALGHALAALYHHYVLKDRVLKRMLPGGIPA